MSEYKTFEELKEELGDKFEDYMYKANIELLNQLQQKENIIKGVREYVKLKMEIRKKCENIYSYDIRNDDYIKQVDELLEILDKENK